VDSRTAEPKRKRKKDKFLQGSVVKLKKETYTNLVFRNVDSRSKKEEVSKLNGM